MIKNEKQPAIPNERIMSQIYFIRGEKVMFDRDLAELYGVETRLLKQAVKRNLDRFPADFMFQLNKKELEIWRSQIVMSKSDKQGLRWLPIVFTEQGVAMLSAVLKSKRAVAVSIQIVRTFVKLREILSTHKQLREKVELMEDKYDKSFKVVFQMIAQLMKEDAEPKKRIGF
ncbi:MAG: ORF6N domain-containing protein [Parcubacteria group bacterium]|jgi:phage regulator Rha-like protein